MKIIWPALAATLFVTAAFAENVLPDRRLVFSRNMDFFGGDMSPIFDTTQSVCEEVCLADPACKALTYNVNSRACFPKFGIERRDDFAGAVSAEIIEMDQSAIALGNLRASDLGFLKQEDFDAALMLARDLGQNYVGGRWSIEDLLATARARLSDGNLSDARYWTAAALARVDAADLWGEFARISLELASAEKQNRRKRALQADALSASVNAYLRSGTGPLRIASLLDLGQSLEQVGRGRSVIPALRLAQSIQARPDVEIALNRVIEKYGFRVVDTSVESDLAEPRVCVVFSEAVKSGADFAPFVRVNGAEGVLIAQDERLCIGGLTHGTRYQIALRDGLPAQSGETLARSVDLSQYVRDRRADVRFPGRAYVLPRTDRNGLPIISVNTDSLDLTVRRIEDRNVLRSIQDGLFGQSLARWQEASLDAGVGETVWSGRMEVEPRLNADVTTRVPVDKILSDYAPGLYAVTAAVPEQGGERATQWFVLSDLGLTTLSGDTALSVLVNRLGDAAPAEGVEVTLLSVSNRELAQSVTDAQGFAQFDAPLLRGQGGAAPALVVARAGDDLSFLSLQDAAFDLSDRGVEGRAPSGPLDLLLTTDRGAYRPGDKIDVVALLRDDGASAVDGLPITFVLRRPDGVEAARQVSSNPRAGGHHVSFDTPPNAPRGTWILAAYSDPKRQALAQQRILVEDFVPDRIEVEMVFDDRPLMAGETADLRVLVDYLFGAPGVDLPVETELVVRQVRNLASYPGFVFGRHEAAFDRRRIRVDPVRTDARGEAIQTLTIPNLRQEGLAFEAEIIASVRDGSERPVSRQLTRDVQTKGVVLGLRPQFDGTAPEESDVAFSVLGLQGSATATLPIQWELNRLRTRYELYELYGQWRWEATTTRERVASGDIITGSTPTEISAPVGWGEYEMVVRTADGPYAETSTTFWAGWQEPADATQTPDMLEVALDKSRYTPGDRAEVLINARYAGVARIAVLASDIVEMRTEQLNAGETRIALPVTDDWGQGAYVTVQLLTGTQSDRLVPGRALGLAHAAVDPGPRALDVVLITPEKISPRSTLRPSVEVTGLAPNEEAYISLAAVDVGIINITGHSAPNPQKYFFGKRALGVEMRDLYGRLIDGTQGVMGALRQGGDGTGASLQASPPPTEDLVAWTSGIVRTDAQGSASFDIDVPDFNGTLRLAAMVWTDEGVGQAEQKVLVQDPVVMTVAMPRFLAPGDTSRIGLDLTNVAAPSDVMSLSISAPGLAGDLNRDIAIETGDSQRVTLPITAGAERDYRIEARLELADGRVLEKTLTLGVRDTSPRVARQTRLSLAPGQTLRLDDNVFGDLQRATAEVTLSAGPKASFNVPRLLSDLERYPYGCTEQLTSRALPLLYMSAVSDRLGLATEIQVAERINTVISQIAARQSSNGGFGLWRVGGGDIWLNAYVTDFLSRARASGYEVPGRMFDLALDNLGNRVSAAQDLERDGAGLSYAMMVLAREGRAQLSDLRYFADEKAAQLTAPLASAHLGTALALYGEPRRSDRLFVQANASLSDTTTQGWRDDYGTGLRDTAGVYALSTQIQSTALDRTALARRLARADGPMSSQEAAWMLMAAHEARGALADASVTIDGVALDQASAARFAPGNVPRDITNNSENELAIVVTSQGRRAGPTEASGNGFRITRRYFSPNGAPIGGSFEVGERYIVVLDVMSTGASTGRIMINDPFPAGLEVDNPNLIRSGDISGLKWLKPTPIVHSEFRTERFLAAVDLRKMEPVQVAYAVRAVSPGTFSHPAASAEDMYRPTLRGTTASAQVDVRP
ncbi:MAG: alpha-2-macroglobulin family protein [Marinovum sp.]|nr:alpha-2-macroglobulin family protein [Marinovum sp.]